MNDAIDASEEAVLRLTAAFAEAIDDVGVEGLKDTSMFGSQPAQPVAVKVKPLVWEAVTDDGRIQDALGLNTVYRVWLSTDGISRWQAKYMGEWFFADNPEAAKAAAQADYEARIMAALDVQPLTVQDAARMVMHILGRSSIDAAFSALPPDACGTIADGEMERVLMAALRAIAEGK